MGPGCWVVPLFQHAHVLARCRGGNGWLAPARWSAALGPRGRPDGSWLDYTQCHSASSCRTGARSPRTLYRERSPASSSPCLTAAGNETQDACLALARACLASLPLSPWKLGRQALGVARGGGRSWERDSDCRPGSGSGQLSLSYSLNWYPSHLTGANSAGPQTRNSIKIRILSIECQSQRKWSKSEKRYSGL